MADEFNVRSAAKRLRESEEWTSGDLMQRRTVLDRYVSGQATAGVKPEALTELRSTLYDEALTDEVKSFTGSKTWEESDPVKRRAGVRKFVVDAQRLGMPPEDLYALSDRLYEEAGSLGALGWTKQAVVEGLKSIPAGAGALLGTATDAVGITQTGSEQRLKEGWQTGVDSLAQRVKQLDPNDEQETRDGVWGLFKQGIDSGDYPAGLLDYLTGEQTPAAQEGAAYFGEWQDLTLKSAISADAGRAEVPRLFGEHAQFQRGLYDPRTKELLADYIATRDPASWQALQNLGTETAIQWKTRLRQENNPLDPRTMRQDIAKEGREPTLMEDLAMRSGEFQTSPVDMGLSLFPLLKGAQALQAARAGNMRQAIKNTAAAAGVEFASGAASSALEDPRNTLGQMAEAGAQEAVGGGAVAGGGAVLGKVMNFFRRGDAPAEQAAPAAAGPEGAPAAAVAPGESIGSDEPVPVPPALPDKPASPPLLEADAAPAAAAPVAVEDTAAADTPSLDLLGPLAALAGTESTLPQPDTGPEPTAAASTLETGAPPAAATEMPAEVAGAAESLSLPADESNPAESDLKRGDRFVALDGTEFEVWKHRQGVLEAHPVVNGKPVVNNQTGVRFATTQAALDRNPADRSDLLRRGQLTTPGTAEAAPVPDSADTVAEQLRLTTDTASTRAATLITPGTPRPDKVPGLKPYQSPHGLVLYNPKKTTLEQVKQAAAGETFDGSLLGMSGQPVTIGTVAVTASTPDAPNVQAELVSSPQQLPAAIAAAKAAILNGTVEVKPAGQVLTERKAAAKVPAASKSGAAAPGKPNQRAKETAGQPPAGAAAKPAAAPAPAEKPKKPRTARRFFRPDPEVYKLAASLRIKPLSNNRHLAKWRREQKGKIGQMTAKDAAALQGRGEYDGLPTIGEYAGRPRAQDALRLIYSADATQDPPNAFKEQGWNDLEEGIAQLRRELNSMDTVAREEKAQETAERQGEAFLIAIEEGPVAVAAEELKKGDVLDIEGTPVTVLSVKSDEDGYVTRVVLEDGRRFGRQVVDGTQMLYVEGYEPTPRKQPDPVEFTAPALDPYRVDFLEGTADDPFNLVSETAADRAKREAREDRERAAREAKAAAEARAAADKAQGRMFEEDDVPFSKGQSKPTGTATTAPTPVQVEAAVKLLGRNAPQVMANVRVLEGMDDLNATDFKPEDWQSLNEYRPEGFYNRRTGVTTILTRHIRPRKGETGTQAVARVILHERVGHAGLGLLRQDPAFRRRWEKLVAAVPDAALDEVRALYPEYAAPDQRDNLVEEWFARQAEAAPTAPPGSPLRQLWEAIKDFIARAYRGISGKVDIDAMARDLLKASLRALRREALAQRQSTGEGLRMSNAPGAAQQQDSTPPGGPIKVEAYRGAVDGDFLPSRHKDGIHWALNRDEAEFWSGQRENGSVRRATLTFKNLLDFRGVHSKASLISAFANAGIPSEAKINPYKDSQNADWNKPQTYLEIADLLDRELTARGGWEEFNPNMDLTDNLGGEVKSYVDGIAFNEHGNRDNVAFIALHDSVIEQSPAPASGADGLAYSRPPAEGAMDERAVPEGFEINRYGLRLKADERLRESWRASFDPALYQTFTEEALGAAVQQWIGQQGGLEGAAALFLDDASGLRDFERNALGQQLAVSLDQRAARQMAAGNPALEDTEALQDSVVTRLEQLATQAGQALRAFGMWARFSPRGIVRAVERKAAAQREEEVAADIGAPAGTVFTTVKATTDAVSADAEADRAAGAKKVSQTWIEKLARAHSDTLGWAKPATLSKLEQLIRAHMREVNPAFTAEAAALGVPEVQADILDKLVREDHRRRAGIKREQEAAALIRQLSERATPKAKAKVPAFVNYLLKAAEKGALTRADFLDAYAQAFDKPRFTADFAQKVRAQVERVQQQPEGSWLRNREQAALMAMLAKHEGLKAGDIWTAFWYANILSGLATQAVNIAGSAVHLLLKTVTVALTNHPQHTINFVRGLLAGAAQGGKQSAAAFVRGEPVMRGDEQWQRMDVLELLWNDDPQTWGKKLAKYGAASWGRYVFRALSAADAFFWNTAKEGKAFLELSRAKARGESIRTAAGLDAAAWDAAQTQAAAELMAGTGRALKRDIDRRAYEIVEAQRDARITAEARKFGAETTYNYEPQGFMGAIAAGLNNFQRDLQQRKGAGAGLARGLVRSVVPFVRIVANITDKNLDFSPWGAVRAIKGGHIVGADGETFTNRERAERAAQAAIGTLGGAALYMLAAANADEDDESVPFMIYGRGPTDKNRRAQMPQGWKPFSMKIGGTYVSFEGTPLAFVLGTLGTAMDQTRYSSKRDADATYNKTVALLTAAPRTLLNSGVLSSLNQTFEMLNGDRKPGAWAERTAASFIPAASFLKDVAVALDPVQVDNTKFGAVFLSYLPFARGEAQPLLNAFGEPVKAPGPWILQRLVTFQERQDPDASFLARNGLRIPGLDNEVAVGAYLEKNDKPRSAGGSRPDRAFRADTLDRLLNGYLTPEERTQFLKTTGPQVRKAVAILRQKAAAGRPVEQQDINNAVSRIRRAGMKELIR